MSETKTQGEIAAEWHAKRLRCIGGSEIATLFDKQATWAPSRYALWKVKAGLMPADGAVGERPKWGLRLESAIAHGAAEDNGWQLLKGSHQLDNKTDGMGATLDFIIYPTSKLRAAGFLGSGVMQVKNVDFLQHRDYWTGAEPPVYVLLQLQHELAVTSFSWGVVVALIAGNDLRIYYYKRDEELIAEIRSRVTDFWNSIRENNPPPPEGTDSDFEAVKHGAVWQKEEVLDLTYDNEAPELCAEMVRASADKKDAETRYSKARNRLLAKMTGFKKAFVTGYKLKVSEIPPASYTVEREATVRLNVREDS